MQGNIRPVQTLDIDMQSLLALLRQPACLTDSDGEIRHANAAWRHQAGANGATHGHLAQMLARDDRDALMAHLQTDAAQQDGESLECRLRDAHGRYRWFLLHLQPQHLGGREHGWLCIATDIHALRTREQQHRDEARARADMLNVSPDCIKMISPDGRLIYMNRAGCEALGLAPDDPLGMEWLSLLPPEVRNAGEAALARVRGGQPDRFAGRSQPPGQAPQHWDNLLTPVRGENGGIDAILCVSREVTTERQTQESLQQSQERLAIAARVGGLGIWDYDLLNDTLQCDDAWYRIMGRDPGQPVRSVAEFRPLIHPDDAERATDVRSTAAQLAAKQGDYAIVFRIVRPDGEIRWVRSAACLLVNSSGMATRAVGFVIDITDARRGEQALRDANDALEVEKQSLARQSLEDPLTGLANRRALDRELARLCTRPDNTGVTIAVVMLDVDYFKAYNDRYGHLMGDEALRGIATALRSIAGQCDFIARYGGEEFVVVLSGMDDPNPVLDRLYGAIQALDIPHATSPFGRVTISCGCLVLRPGELPAPARLLEACDAALYAAKASGRGCRIVRTA